MEYSNPSKVCHSKCSKSSLSDIELDETNEDYQKPCNKFKFQYQKNICSNNAQFNDKNKKEELPKYLTNHSYLENPYISNPFIKEQLILNTKSKIEDQMKQNQSHHHSQTNNNHQQSYPLESKIPLSKSSFPTRSTALNKQNINLIKDSSSPSIKTSTNASDNGNEGLGLLFLTCMNCGNSIAIDNIEEHSSKCIKVTEEILKNENKNHELKSIDYKLRKLKEHINNILNGLITLPESHEKELKYYAMLLCESVTLALHLEGVSLVNIKEYKKILKGLEVISLTNKPILSSQILIDRTKVLINEKLKRTRELYRTESKYDASLHPKIDCRESNIRVKRNKNEYKNQLKGETKVKSSGNKNLILLPEDFECQSENKTRNILIINGQKKNIEKENTQKIIEDYQSLHSFSNNNLSQGLHRETIISDVDIRSRVFSINTSISNSSDKEHDHVNVQELLQSKAINFDVNTIYEDEIQNKKDFYKMIFKIKFEKLHSSHKGQFIPHDIIWNECKRAKIDKDKWTKFILAELNNPLKYAEATSKIFHGKRPLNMMPRIDEEKLY